MTNDEYPYLAQLSVPDRLRIAAYEAGDHGVPAVHLKAILDAAEELERCANGTYPDAFSTLIHVKAGAFIARASASQPARDIRVPPHI